jgi:hypothetical protein
VPVAALALLLLLLLLFLLAGSCQALQVAMEHQHLRGRPR